jgi:hypothetical protein
MRTVLTAAIIALTALPGIAQAAESPCLTANEFTSLASYALPSIISGTSQRCAATLPGDAYLKRNGAQLVSRYALAKPAAWAGAKPAFLKLGVAGANRDTIDVIKGLPDQTLQQLADAMIEGMVAQKLPAERCGTIDRMVRLVSPLPAENTAELISLAVGLGSRSGGGRIAMVNLCPA